MNATELRAQPHPIVIATSRSRPGPRPAPRPVRPVEPADEVEQRGLARPRPAGKIFRLDEHLARCTRLGPGLAFAPAAEDPRITPSTARHAASRIRLPSAAGSRSPRAWTRGSTRPPDADRAGRVQGTGVRRGGHLTASVRRPAPVGNTQKLVFYLLGERGGGRAGRAVVLDHRGFIAETNATHLSWPVVALPHGPPCWPPGRDRHDPAHAPSSTPPEAFVTTRTACHSGPRPTAASSATRTPGPVTKRDNHPLRRPNRHHRHSRHLKSLPKSNSANEFHGIGRSGPGLLRLAGSRVTSETSGAELACRPGNAPRRDGGARARAVRD